MFIRSIKIILVAKQNKQKIINLRFLQTALLLRESRPSNLTSHLAALPLIAASKAAAEAAEASVASMAAAAAVEAAAVEAAAMCAAEVSRIYAASMSAAALVLADFCLSESTDQRA